MLHRRAIHKLYNIRSAELPKYERYKTHTLMDDKYAASDKSKAARKLKDGRLTKLRDVAAANLDSGVTLSDASDNSDSGVWSIAQHRLKRVPNVLSEKGVSVRVIQELARHSDLSTTQRYIDVSLDKLRNAVNLVGI